MQGEFFFLFPCVFPSPSLLLTTSNPTSPSSWLRTVAKLLSEGIPCVFPQYLVEWVANPHESLQVSLGGTEGGKRRRERLREWGFTHVCGKESRHAHTHLHARTLSLFTALLRTIRTHSHPFHARMLTGAHGARVEGLGGAGGTRGGEGRSH